MPIRSRSEAGQAMLEFSIVSISLVFMFAGAFTVGTMLSKALQVSNVTRSAAVLMVRSVTDPTQSLNLANATNQRILMREANGLGMSTDASFDPLTGAGNGAIFLSQIIAVGALQCSAAGLTARTTGPPWDTGNCHNFGSYAWTYYVAIANNTRWSSAFGTPPSGDVQTNGSISALNIAQDTGDRVSNTTMNAAITLTAASGQYALISETYADISSIAIFAGWYTPPVIYYRTIT
jgi:hypothetical protein